MRLVISTVPYLKTAMTRTVAASFMLLGAGLPLAVTAQQVDDDSSESSWGLGLAVVTSQKAYTDIDRDNKVLPILSYENRYIRLAGPELAVKLPGYQFSESNKISFSIIGKYDFTDYEQSDAPILNGMEDRDGGFWAGFKAEWQNSLADISAEYVTEVSGDSEGNAFNFAVERTWHFKQQFMFTPRLVVSLLDKNYVDYYYGVRANEVTADRAYYQGESAVNFEVGARGGYMFKQKHFVFLDVSVTSLASEIKDSPLVDSSTENWVMLGYIYRF
ncbi:outer membrane protein [Rheinheimera pacifica]|uniref:MipA/OmpV family protein n=1 Tax=Rheinheimera pacifica TaxID=173990 RepID=UPI00216A3093|nr:MipA/OmpV family protein [Rheinheimera pacifica]MCS4306178.1 outer membrane protein [Rheinheimera pacifica]